jgi:hypothetical protein
MARSRASRVSYSSTGSRSGSEATSVAEPRERDAAEELGADPTELPEVHEEKMRRFLVHLDVRRDLVLHHRAIEDWLAEWQAAEQSQGSRASLDASSE